jgi:capsid assembly protease
VIDDILIQALRSGRPWALMPEYLRTLAMLGSDAELSIGLSEAQVEVARSRSRLRSDGSVAIVPLHGMITPKGSLLNLLFGGAPGGLESFRAELTSAAGNSDIKAIVMDVDSPGGLVDQVPETAALVREVRKTKPVVSIANPLAASAGYWLASQATQLVVSSSGEAGSIGVYNVHRDLSAALEQRGIKPTVVSAGKYKVEASPFEPLNSEARAAVQDTVNDYYEMFIKDVARGRGASQQAVRNGYGEGRVLTSQRALKAGLVDAVQTLDEVVGGLAGGHMPAGRVLAPAAISGFDFDDQPIELVADDGVWKDAAQDNDDRMNYTAEDKLRLFAVLAD